MMVPEPPSCTRQVPHIDSGFQQEYTRNFNSIYSSTLFHRRPGLGNSALKSSGRVVCLIRRLGDNDSTTPSNAPSPPIPGVNLVPPPPLHKEKEIHIGLAPLLRPPMLTRNWASSSNRCDPHGRVHHGPHQGMLVLLFVKRTSSEGSRSSTIWSSGKQAQIWREVSFRKRHEAIQCVVFPDGGVVRFYLMPWSNKQEPVRKLAMLLSPSPINSSEGWNEA
ncbi:hypothetical protein BKA70DRAFT_1230073 [Coprinopsis sp. MPI-PUGE-AT-0042]|nr:hypothetical protein BKA70DRAFT_1230073 [Coprinopsis sp. MPI-PUGE-AT-0042]